MAQTIRLIRVPELLHRRGDGRSALYQDIQNGTWPPFVKLGRCSVAPDHEVDAVLAARIAGKSPDELRELVRRLVAERSTIMQRQANPSAAAST